MKIVLLSALVLLAGCSHAGQPSPESSSQEDSKGAIDDPNFLRRFLGLGSENEEPAASPAPNEEAVDEEQKDL